MPHKDPIARAAYAAKYRESRREEAKERSRKWREQNPGRLKEMLHANYVKNKDERIQKSRKYYQEHAEEIHQKYADNIELYKERDRASYLKHRESRLAKDREYRQTEKGKAAKIRQALRHKKRNPLKWHARALLRLMVKRGKVFKLPCVVCGTRVDVHGHHEDYAKPLDVVWLCRTHHNERHTEIKTGGNL